MRHHVVVKEERRKHSRTTCDRCGGEIVEFDGFDVETVSIQCISGKRYPEGDFRTVVETDCCRTCFDTVVVPAMKKSGFQFRTRDHDEVGSVLDVKEGS